MNGIERREVPRGYSSVVASSVATRAISDNSQADFHQHVIMQLYVALAPTIKEPSST
jgi:hypothetical protein